jgi:hypothetical protein
VPKTFGQTSPNSILEEFFYLFKQILLTCDLIGRIDQLKSHVAVKETTACQKREEKKFGKYVCVRTRQSGDRTSLVEFRLFCTRPCQPT